MERKLFESRGIPKKQAVLLFVCSIVTILGGFFFIALSNAKHKGISIYSTTQGKLGTLGGGYMFDEDAQNTLFIIGIIVILLGIDFIFNLITMQKSVFKVFDGHIEGKQYITGIIITLKSEFDLEYDQITEVQLTKTFRGSNLEIVTQGKTYHAILKSNEDRVYRFIKQKIKNPGK